MSTDTVLNAEKVIEIVRDAGPDDPLSLARAIEQAVLQSPEVQAWKRDAERLKKACRIAVLALAHAHKERGEVYRLAYEEVDAAIRETQP